MVKSKIVQKFLTHKINGRQNRLHFTQLCSMH